MTIKQILLLAILNLALLVGCNASTKVRTQEEKRFSTKLEDGKLVKDELIFHFFAAFREDGMPEYSIDNMLLDPTDTLRYPNLSVRVEGNKTFCYDDGKLDAIEWKKGDSLFIYYDENCITPANVRIMDKKGCYRLKQYIFWDDGCFLYLYSDQVLDSKGYSISCRQDELYFSTKSDMFRYEEKGDESLVEERRTRLTERTYTYYD